MCRLQSLDCVGHLAAIMRVPPPPRACCTTTHSALMHKHALALVGGGMFAYICMHAKLIYAMQTSTARYRIVHESYPPALSLNISFCPHFSLEQPYISSPLVHGGIAQLKFTTERQWYEFVFLFLTLHYHEHPDASTTFGADKIIRFFRPHLLIAG